MHQVLPNGIGGSLIPAGAGESLFRGKNFDEPTREVIKLVALGNVAMQRGRVELGQEVDTLELGIDAIRNGDIHQPILSG